MSTDKIIDHLFRNEYGKMVSSLTRLFGVGSLEMIEDVVQDTFQKAVLHFRNKGIPDQPEAWLRTVARNRAIDIWRKKSRKQESEIKNISGPSAIALNEVFTDNEIKDNQLRLLFTICHPSLKPRDQIIFALKTFSGFSRNEIATALLQSEENIKKSLQRARKKVVDEKVKFEVPTGKEVVERISNIHLVLYLLFNEGFHSSNKKQLVRKDIVAEAMRLTGLLIDKFQLKETKALLALMCFHGARLHSKISADNDLITLRQQDRKKWSYPLILRGHQLMEEAIKDTEYTRYHWEAAIAGEYVKSPNFENIDWPNLEIFYNKLLEIIPSPFNQLNLCVILIQQNKIEEVKACFYSINPKDLHGRQYLFYAVASEIAMLEKDNAKAIDLLLKALQEVQNESEKNLILKKLKRLQ